MMKPVFYSPSPKCSPLVTRYIFLKYDKDDQIFYDKYIPDGHTSFVFHFEENFYYKENGKKKTLPRFFITDLLSHSLEMEVHPPCDSMIIICNSSVFSRVFNLELTNPNEVPYKIIDPFKGISMYENLAITKTDKEKIKVFEDYLIKNVMPEVYEPDEIDLIYEKIISQNGNSTIAEILEEINLNHRTLRRLFLKRIGISMKKLLGIIRVNYVWNYSRKAAEFEPHNITFNCRYFDQSHFINDFKKIIGETPRSFFKRNLELVEIFSGRKPESRTAVPNFFPNE
ncbi:MAG: helix-turn-helix domain-containing protein [Bacteroidota bacterium]